MNEVLKSHFEENEFIKVESEIEKDISFKEVYDKIKNTADYRLNKLEEKIEKTDETFNKRFEAFKKAVLEAEKKQNENFGFKSNESEEQIKQDSYKKLNDVVLKKSGFIGTLLSGIGFDINEIAKEQLDDRINGNSGLNVENNSTGDNFKDFFNLSNLKKIIGGFILGMFGINTDIDKITGEFNNLTLAFDNITAAGDYQVDRVKTEGTKIIGEGKKLLQDAEYKLKQKQVDFSEKMTLDPDVIHKEFTNKFLKLFLSNEELNKQSDYSGIIKSLETKTFEEIKNNNKSNDVYDKLTTTDSFNLINPFLSNRIYLKEVVNSEYFKKCFQDENRFKQLNVALNKSDFDWQNVFTWKEITVILSKKLAYLGTTTIEGIKGVLTDQEILNKISSVDDVKGLLNTVSGDASNSLNVLKYSYEFQKNGNIGDIIEKGDKNEFINGTDEKDKSLKSVYEFSKNIIYSSLLDNFQKDLGLDFKLKEFINGSFSMVNMAKLYVLLNGNSDYSKWGDSEKITFITWLSSQLNKNDSDKELSNLGSAVLEKVFSDNTDDGFISPGVKNFLKSGASILGKKAISEEVIKPFEMLKGVVQKNLPDALKGKDPDSSEVNKFLTDSTSSLVMAFGVLLMLYPAYKVTKFMTNKYIISLALGGSLAYYGYNQGGDWLKDISNKFTNLFSGN